MQLKDTLTLEGWLRGRVTYYEVMTMEPVGIVGNVRFTEQARRLYKLLWEWSTYRMSSNWQERCWKKHGREFVDRRIKRVRLWIAKFLNTTELQFFGKEW